MSATSSPGMSASAGAGDVGAAGRGAAAVGTGTVILDASQVTKAFGGLVAVNQVDFRVERNEIVALIGPNGAGKTTLFNAITGVYPPYLRKDMVQRSRYRRTASL